MSDIKKNWGERLRDHPIAVIVTLAASLAGILSFAGLQEHARNSFAHLLGLSANVSAAVPSPSMVPPGRATDTTPQPFKEEAPQSISHTVDPANTNMPIESVTENLETPKKANPSFHEIRESNVKITKPKAEYVLFIKNESRIYQVPFLIQTATGWQSEPPLNPNSVARIESPSPSLVIKFDSRSGDRSYTLNATALSGSNPSAGIWGYTAPYFAFQLEPDGLIGLFSK